MNTEERESLLHENSRESGDAPSEPLAGKGRDPSKYGPLDISRSTRYGILAGIWAGNFLSVSASNA